MRKNNCNGTKYKINNRIYCVGEKNKSKKMKKSQKLKVKLKNYNIPNIVSPSTVFFFSNTKPKSCIFV